MKISTDGLVIWETKTGEADRVITLLTANGVVTAYAKSSLRPKSKLTSATMMLSYSDFELYSGKNMYTADAAHIKHRFAKLSLDVKGYALAIYFCELLKLLAPIDDDAGDFMSLSLNSLHLLDGGRKDMPIVKTVFEWRAAMYAGYMPDLVECNVCGEHEAHDSHLDIHEGILLCRQCAEKCTKPINAPAAVVRATRYILCNDLNKAFSFELGAESLKILGDLSERFILDHLERPLPTLDFYKALAQD